jgi:hypothetical protein
MKPISIPAETALLTDFNSLDCLDGAVLSSFENERPLLGLLGQLDWRLSGEFTRLVRAGQITGKKNESVYVPKNWNQKKIHLLVVGRGI